MRLGPSDDVVEPARNGNNDAVELSMPSGVVSGDATQAAFEFLPFHQMRLDVSYGESKQRRRELILAPSKLNRMPLV